MISHGAFVRIELRPMFGTDEVLSRLGREVDRRRVVGWKICITIPNTTEGYNKKRMALGLFFPVKKVKSIHYLA